MPKPSSPRMPAADAALLAPSTCTGTGLTPAHLHYPWARPSHTCSRIDLRVRPSSRCESPCVTRRGAAACRGACVRPAAATAVPCLQPLCLPMPCGPYSVWLANIMRQPCRARRCVWPCSSCDPCKTHRGLGQGRWVPRASRPMRWPRCSARQAIRTRAQSALGRFSACPGADVGGAERSPGADLGGVSPVGADVGGVSPVALSGCRCGRRARPPFAVRSAGGVSRGSAALPCTPLHRRYDQSHAVRSSTDRRSAAW